MLISENERIPKEANLLRLYIPLQWTQIFFCDIAILFLKKITMFKFSNESGSEPLLAWKRAPWILLRYFWVQAETGQCQSVA